MATIVTPDQIRWHKPYRLTAEQVGQIHTQTLKTRTPIKAYKLQKAIENYQAMQDKAFQRDHGASICRYWEDSAAELGKLNQYGVMIGNAYFHSTNQEDLETGIFDTILGDTWRQALHVHDVEDFQEILTTIQNETGNPDPKLDLGTWTHPKTGETRLYINNWLELCGVKTVKNYGRIEHAEFEGRQIPGSRLDAFTRGKVWLDEKDNIHVNIHRWVEAYLAEDVIRMHINAVRYHNQGLI